MYLIIGVGAWCLVPHLHHSKVITHFVQERGSEIEWKHLIQQMTIFTHTPNAYTHYKGRECRCIP